MKITLGETLFEVDPAQRSLRIIATSGPMQETRPADEDPSAYTAAARVFYPGALFRLERIDDV